MQPINYLSAMPQIDLGASLFNGLRAGQGIQESRQLREMRDIQIQQARAEQEQANSFRTDIDKLLADPTPEGYAAMFARYPSFQKALSASWETRDKAAKESDLRELSGIYAAGQSGRWDVAVSALKRRIEADRAAGQDTTEDEEALRIAENGTPEEKRALLGMTGVQLAATLGPDKFTDAYKELNPNQQREGKVVGDYLVDPVTGEVRFQAPTDSKYMNVDGNLVEIPGAPGMQGSLQDTRGAPGTGTSANSAPWDMGDLQGLFERMIQQESGGQQFGADGKPLRSPKGAIGIAQVMPKTGPEAAQLAGLPWDVKRFHTDPEYNAALGKAYFQKQLSDFEDPALAAAAYNAGPKRVQDALRKGGANGWINHVPEETRNYVSNVVPARSGGAPKVLFSKPKEDGYTQLTPQEVSALGLPIGTVAQRGPNGKIDVINKGDAADAPYSQSALDAFDRAIGTAGRLLEHPGFESAVGMKGLSGGLLGGWTVPGTDAADFNAELEAMKAQVFLPMVQSMKGMGQLSNAEGQKLTDAIGALDTKMSEGAFKKSLQRIIGDLTTYRNRGAGKDGGKSPDLSNGGILNVRTAEEYNALPPGAEYRDPQGNLRRKR